MKNSKLSLITSMINNASIEHKLSLLNNKDTSLDLQRNLVDNLIKTAPHLETEISSCKNLTDEHISHLLNSKYIDTINNLVHNYSLKDNQYYTLLKDSSILVHVAMIRSPFTPLWAIDLLKIQNKGKKNYITKTFADIAQGRLVVDRH